MSPATTMISFSPSSATSAMLAIVCQLDGRASRLIAVATVDTIAAVPTKALSMFRLFIFLFVFFVS